MIRIRRLRIIVLAPAPARHHCLGHRLAACHGIMKLFIGAYLTRLVLRKTWENQDSGESEKMGSFVS